MVAHFVAVLFTGFIVYTASPGSDLFSWHPTLMGLAVSIAPQFAFFMLEGILVFSPESSLLSRASHATKVRAHWVCMVMALFYGIGGMMAIFLNKERVGKPHLTSWHSKLGMFGNFYTFVQCIAGVFLLYPNLIPKRLNMKLGVMKAYHATSGLALFAVICGTIVLGMFSKWFTDQVTGTSWYACIACPMISILVVMNQVSNRYLPKQG